MEKEVVVSASSYEQKYYFNTVYDTLPKEVKEEMRIICVSTAHKTRGIFSMGFYADGNVFLETSAVENDLQYDEIGAKLEIERIQKEKKELIRSLSLWYQLYRTEKGIAIKEKLTSSLKSV